MFLNLLYIIIIMPSKKHIRQDWMNDWDILVEYSYHINESDTPHTTEDLKIEKVFIHIGETEPIEISEQLTKTQLQKLTEAL